MYWVTGILGAVMAGAPFALGYNTHSGAMWTGVVLGVIVLLVSIYEAMDESKAKWEYWIAGIAGVLVVGAPFVLGFTTVSAALWTTLILGLVLLILTGYEVFFVSELT